MTLSTKEELFLIKLFNTNLTKKKEKDTGTLNEFINELGDRTSSLLRNLLKACVNENILVYSYSVNTWKIYKLDRTKLVKKLNEEGKIFNDVGLLLADSWMFMYAMGKHNIKFKKIKQEDNNKGI